MFAAVKCSLGSLAGARRLLGGTREVRICAARAVNDGKHIDIEFADNTAYRFHTAWIKDSSPSVVGVDYYRKSANAVFDLEKYTAVDVQPTDSGNKLLIQYQNGSLLPAEEYVSNWLHAFAPFVGRALHSKADNQTCASLQGTGSLFDDARKSLRPWGSELQIPIFDAEELVNSQDKQIEFLETMCDPGAALITNVGPPQSLENNVVGLPLENLVGKIIGRINQHPVRSTRYGIMHTRPQAELAGADYDMANPLSMHTDHSVYNGTPGYLQFMYQAQGSVTSKVCDGLALANYLKEHHPEDFELLTTVQITHSSRNNIYAKNGCYKSDAPAAEGATFELVHTHPIIELDKYGNLEKVVQSETKRGVSALPFHKYERFMKAYTLWTGLAEDPRFVCNFEWPEHTMVAINNWRLLHGRASVRPNTERTMCFGYVMRTIVENRYRLLKQTQTEKRNPLMHDKWLTRVPNQVLKHLVL